MKCNKCSKETPIGVYESFSSNPICLDCFLIEKEVNKEQIDALPDIVDIEAPLGYSFIVKRYFSDEELGKAYADKVFWSFGGYR